MSSGRFDPIRPIVLESQDMTQTSKNEKATKIYEESLDLLKKGHIKEAVAKLQGIGTQIPMAWGVIAWVYRAQGKYESALAYLRRYMEIVPDDIRAWSMLAGIACDQRDFEHAEQYTQHALSLAPKNAPLWYDLAEIYMYTRRWKDAIRAYDECLKIEPEHSKAVIRRQVALRSGSRGRLQSLKKSALFRSLIDRILELSLINAMYKLKTGIPLYDRRWNLSMKGGVQAGYEDRTGERKETDDAGTEGENLPFRQWYRSLQIRGPVHKVLEIGLRSGDVADFLTHTGCQVLSVTPSEFARRDRERRGIVAWRVDFHNIGKRGTPFDLVIANHALQHSCSPLFALWEWKRLLRPDGYLIIMTRLAVDRPAPTNDTNGNGAFRLSGEYDLPQEARPRISRNVDSHYTFGIPGQIITMTYWQLRWLFKLAEFQLLAETLEDPQRICLEGVEHLDGRLPSDPTRAWNAFYLLRKPGSLPYDASLEKPRPIASDSK